MAAQGRREDRPMPDGTPKATVGPTPPTIDFVKPASPGSFSVGASEPSADQIEFGLWDHLITPGGTVNLGTDEDKNVIGSDSRRFYIRVRDPSAKGRGFIEVDWWTAFTPSVSRTPGTIQDDPKSVLNLFEVSGSPGVFTSRAVMLVVDAVDRSVTPNSGIPSSDPKLGSQAGNRTDKQSNFRIRRCGMHKFAVASYTPKKTGKAKPVTALAPVFLAKNKKLLTVQVYVVRVSAGGAPSIPTADIFDKDLKAITETYERIGVWFWATVTDADKTNDAVQKVSGPPALHYDICVVDPPKGVDPTKLNTPDVAALGRAFPAGSPKSLRLFFVSDFHFTDLTEAVDGRTFGITPDASLPDCPPLKEPPDAAGICVVRANRGDDYTAAHELGHLLTNKEKMRKGKIKPDDLFDGCIAEGHYRLGSDKRRIKMNLMEGFGAFVPAQRFLDPKRIWDELDDDKVNQFAAIRSSRFLSP
jgi:hypothetical protein